MGLPVVLRSAFLFRSRTTTHWFPGHMAKGTKRRLMEIGNTERGERGKENVSGGTHAQKRETVCMLLKVKEEERLNLSFTNDSVSPFASPFAFSQTPQKPHLSYRSCQRSQSVSQRAFPSSNKPQLRLHTSCCSSVYRYTPTRTS
jgi:hypothetical protein